MKPWLLISLAVSLTVVFSCGRPSPPKKAEITPAPLPVIENPKAGWEVEWESILKTAKKEGKVVLYGPPLQETRKGFIEGFQKAYPDITLDYIALTGSLTVPKINAERRAGIYQVDLHMGGSTSILSSLKENALPIRPFLILPEVKDPSAWRNGSLDFSDEEEKINLVFTHNIIPRIVYNSNLVDVSKMKGGSYWEFVKPEWKEKIVYTDPRISGPGQALATFFYNTQTLGVDFIKALAANKVVLARDSRLMAEWVGYGKYSLLMAPSGDEVNNLVKAGMPLKWAEIMDEGNYLSNAFGSVIVMDKAPHPKAAVVFLNWLLGKEGQTIYTRTSGFLSLRKDAPTDHLMPGLIPQPGAKYLPTYKEKYVKMRDEIVAELTKIFAGF